jgi:Icc-related predicted phosphoesterase
MMASRDCIKRVGSESLEFCVRGIETKLHVFGHIHEGYGRSANDHTEFVNASHVDEKYRAVNPPIYLTLEVEDPPF